MNSWSLYAMVKRDELEKFCARWNLKVESHSSGNLHDTFDKFISLFIIYNRIYSFVFDVSNKRGDIKELIKERKLNKEGDIREQERATICVAYFLKAESNKVIYDCRHEIKEIERIMSVPPLFNITLSKGEPRPAKDKKILKELKSDDKLKVLETMLLIIYRVRCNLFHGEKGFNENQKLILDPLTTYLQKVITILLLKIEKL